MLALLPQRQRPTNVTSYNQAPTLVLYPFRFATHKWATARYKADSASSSH
jgi:hypothetical protein